MTTPNIFEYTDFRKYLKEFQKAKRSTDKRFTKSAICKRLGLPNTRSYFNDILAGKIVTPTFLERFVQILELNREEEKYFRVLVQFNQASDPVDRELLFNQLISLNRIPKKTLNEDAYCFYSEWYHGAVRALCDIMDLKDDYKLIASRLNPPITAKMAKESIALLKRLKLIVRNKKGFYKPADKSITTGPYVQSEVIKLYQMKCIDCAQKAMVRNTRLPQNISTNTVSISEETYNEIEKRLQQFKSDIRTIVHKDHKPAQRVYLINSQIVPISK